MSRTRPSERQEQREASVSDTNVSVRKGSQLGEPRRESCFVQEGPTAVPAIPSVPTATLRTNFVYQSDRDAIVDRSHNADNVRLASDVHQANDSRTKPDEKTTRPQPMVTASTPSSITGPEEYEVFHWITSDLLSELELLKSALRTHGGCGPGIQAIDATWKAFNELQRLFGLNTYSLYPQVHKFGTKRLRLENDSYLTGFSEGFEGAADALGQMERAFQSYRSTYYDNRTDILLKSLQKRFKSEAKKANVARGIDSPTSANEQKQKMHDLLTAFLLNAVDALRKNVSRYYERGIPVISSAQEARSARYLNLTTIATFLSAVTATILQITAGDTNGALQTTVNTFLFSSLTLSIASAINSLLAVSWLKSKVRDPISYMPPWVSACLNTGPIFSLAASTALFVGALSLFVFSTSQHLLTSTITISFAGLYSVGLVALATWLLIEKWDIRHLEDSTAQEIDINFFWSWNPPGLQKTKFAFASLRKQQHVERGRCPCTHACYEPDDHISPVNEGGGGSTDKKDGNGHLSVRHPPCIASPTTTLFRPAPFDSSMYEAASFLPRNEETGDYEIVDSSSDSGGSTGDSGLDAIVVEPYRSVQAEVIASSTPDPTPVSYSNQILVNATNPPTYIVLPGSRIVYGVDLTHGHSTHGMNHAVHNPSTTTPPIPVRVVSAPVTPVPPIQTPGGDVPLSQPPLSRIEVAEPAEETYRKNSRQYQNSADLAITDAEDERSCRSNCKHVDIDNIESHSDRVNSTAELMDNRSKKAKDDHAVMGEESLAPAAPPAALSYRYKGCFSSCKVDRRGQNKQCSQQRSHSGPSHAHSRETAEAVQPTKHKCLADHSALSREQSYVAAQAEEVNVGPTCHGSRGEKRSDLTSLCELPQPELRSIQEQTSEIYEGSIAYDSGHETEQRPTPTQVPEPSHTEPGRSPSRHNAQVPAWFANFFSEASALVSRLATNDEVVRPPRRTARPRKSSDRSTDEEAVPTAPCRER